jgi:hypothetical protein
MQNLAYKLEEIPEQETISAVSTAPSASALGIELDSDACPACGQELFGPDAEACSWQAWVAFWEIMGISNVELVCGDCGEYLQEFFSDSRK